jgi:hypothetical protein
VTLATRLYGIVLDALDPPVLGQFWAAALDWHIAHSDDDEVLLHAPWASSHDPGEMLLQRVSDPKTAKNRLHLDLSSETEQQQAATVEKLIDLGAARIDIGQRDVPWVVLADPEGNELCVLEPREVYRGAGAIAAIVVASDAPHELAEFWAHASGWVSAYQHDDIAALRAPTGPGPLLEFLRSDEPKNTKNRLHLDVAPSLQDDHKEEVSRLVRLGAEPADVGQGDVSWVVLTDPGGNEFCVLPPR